MNPRLEMAKKLIRRWAPDPWIYWGPRYYCDKTPKGCSIKVNFPLSLKQICQLRLLANKIGVASFTRGQPPRFHFYK